MCPRNQCLSHQPLLLKVKTVRTELKSTCLGTSGQGNPWLLDATGFGLSCLFGDGNSNFSTPAEHLRLRRQHKGCSDSPFQFTFPGWTMESGVTIPPPSVTLPHENESVPQDR